MSLPILRRTVAPKGRVRPSTVKISARASDGPELGPLSDRAFRVWVHTVCWLTTYERDVLPDHCLKSMRGTTESLSLDHIHPFSKGGLDTVDNLQTMCRPCNSSKGAR